MRVPDPINKCVAFLGIQQGDSVSYGGTCFFTIKYSQEISGMCQCYLVTAKHCVDNIKTKSFAVRVNFKDGTCGEIIGSGHERWFLHPTDNSVDVAVMPFRITDYPNLDQIAIPVSMFFNEDAEQKGYIEQGDEVFITGLFTNFFGNQKNIPIVRIGNMAMMPDEKVSLAEFGHAEVYIIEARSRGGLSGSPVFFRRPVIIKGMPVFEASGKLKRPDNPRKIIEELQKNPFVFLGLIHGHYLLKDNKISKDMQDNASQFIDKINTGISLVVPARKILEVINQPELECLFKDAEKRHSCSSANAS